MTQSPPPHPYPPQYPHGYPYPAADPLAPARKGGLLLVILGTIGLLFGGCFAAMGAIVSKGELQLPPEHPMTKMDPQLVATAVYVFAGAAGVAALLMIILGILARRGSGIACVLGAVLCTLVGLLMLLQLIGVANAGVEGLVVIPIVLVGAGLMGLAIYWLTQGAKAAFRNPQMPAYGYPQVAPGAFPPQPFNPYGQPMQGYYPPPQQQQPPPPPSSNG